MPYVSKEQLTAAREVDLLTYLCCFEPQELVHISGSTYATRTHDSLKISNGKWFWWSRGIGGRNALDYLTAVEGLWLPEAVQRILGESPCIPPPPKPAVLYPKTEFTLPPKHADNRRVFSYLRGRGIDPEIINHCIKHGLLYESAQHHNCVFVGFAGDRPAYAMQRGRDWRKANTLSLGGVGKKDQQLPPALSRYLKDAPHITRIVLCLDNDEPGREAAAVLKGLLGGYEVIDRPPARGKDYNDLLRCRRDAQRGEAR